MVRRFGLVAVAAAALVLAIVSAASARPTAHAAATATCSKGVSIGMQAPITGPAGSIGSDQLHWALFYFTQWNKTHKLKIHLVQEDTQLDPSKASTTAQALASNASVMGVIGPAGSDEVQAVAPIFKKAGLAFASGSATRVSLTSGAWKGYFFRDVPNDGVQGPTDASYMVEKLGVTSGSKVMVVDDQESYSTGLADIVGQSLSSKGVNVDRESVSQKATDFSSLIAKVDSSTKVVFLPFQVASEAQLFAQQLQAQGKTAVAFGSDGTFDSSKFTVNGSYISFFAPDVTTIPADASIVTAFHKQFPGATSPFGAPNYVLAQAYASAVTAACKDNKISRAEVRKDLAKVKLSNTILGGPLSFTANGDVAGAKFHIFKIENGKYVTIA
ncbi:MAG TPA: branched-chain amino acid ABC transporter substrate-binding protein [Gaiellaceae bacterium]|nr:branched-chain amino acid ABC transporter substrate-binding protein [Gaiellaceae bacterium]